MTRKKKTGTRTKARPKKKTAAKKKASPKKKTAAKKKTSPKKKASPKKKTAAKKKTSPKKKVAAKKKASAVRSWPEMLSTVNVPVDTDVYPREAIFGAAYVMMDRAFVHLSHGEENLINVLLTGKAELNEPQLRALGGEFANELVNQMLRITLDETGRKLREYIVAKAHFFQGESGQDVKKLLDSTMEEAFDEDPLDIAVPWEEKYGDGGKG